MAFRSPTSKTSSFMKDNSWIKTNLDEDESVDSPPESPTTETGSSTSVQALSKRFSSGQSGGSTLPGRTSYTKSTSSSSLTDSSKTTKTTTVTLEGSNTTETTITTTQSVSRTVPKSPTKTGTFTEKVFSDVKNSSKSGPYSSFTLPAKPAVTETTEVKVSSTESEDKLFDTLIPASVKNEYEPDDSQRSISKTETVTVEANPDGDDIRTTTTTRTSSSAEDGLYDSLLPRSIRTASQSLSSPSSTSITRQTVTVDSTKRDGITTTTRRTSSGFDSDPFDTTLPQSSSSSLRTASVTRREIITEDDGTSSPRTFTSQSYSSYSNSDDGPLSRTSSYSVSSKPSYEFSSISSPGVYSSTSYDSRANDYGTDSIVSKSSIKSVYSTSERAVLEKDLCTYCRKPFTAEAKMVLEEMKINCHASCFKCEVCHNTLGHLKAGDSMWVYRRTVHCENCFENTREKWRR